LFQAPQAEKNAGFTLIEALVALAIVAVALTSIGSLVATSARGAASIEARLTRLEAARSRRRISHRLADSAAAAGRSS